MVPLQNTKLYAMGHAVNTAANEFTSVYADCLGFDIADIAIVLGTQATTSGNQLDVLKVTEGSNTYSSNSIDITAAIGSTAGHSGTATSFQIPTMDSDVAQIVKIHIDTRTRKRYLFVTISNPGAEAGPFSMIASLSRAEEAPVGASAQNVAVVKNIT